MNKPPINQLLDKVDAKYTLVIIASRRARYLIDSEEEVKPAGFYNPVSAALYDVAEGRIVWERPEEFA